MSTRRRYSDTRSAGPSQLVPFVPGEAPMDRHYRRKNANLAVSDDLETLCRGAGVAFAIKNEGHHWIFEFGDHMAEWWPSSAKLVFDKAWKKGIHAHDHLQVWSRIKAQWGLS